MQPIRPIALILITSLGLQTSFAEKPKAPQTVTVTLPAAPKLKQVEGDQRILHALDRLTFGPRPGDMEEVKEMGLDAWIARQLHPATIDDFALEDRLKQYPAMRLSEEELTRRFPPGNVIRQVENGKISLPLFNSTERAIYQSQLANDKKKQDQDKAAAAALNAAKVQAEAKILTDAQVTTLLALPPAPRMAKVLSLPAGDYTILHRQLTGPQRTALQDGMSPDQVETLVALDNPRQLVYQELLQARVLRALYSQRQLQEVMTDFWLNHFNVFQGKSGEEVYSLVPYERDAIRPRALGSFEMLLLATATSTAMMNYLDNSSSTGPHSLVAMRGGKGGPPKGLNENYARELMELHTLGVNGGYTQRDVTEVAKVFTGWTVQQPPAGGPRFVFDPNRHEPGKKHVLGVDIKESGFQEGLQVLHMLATSPATAHFICNKLAVRFVSDDPPASLVNRLSTVFLASNGNIDEVMRFLVQSPEFWAVTSYRAKVKTPEDFVLSAVRAGGMDVQEPQVIVKAIGDLGQPLYGRQTPDGYGMLSAPWVSSAALLARMNFSLALAANHLSKGVAVDWLGQLGTASSQPPEEQERQLETLLLHGQVSPATQSLVLKQLAGSASPLPAQQQQAAANKASLAAGLLFGSPDFQRR